MPKPWDVNKQCMLLPAVTENRSNRQPMQPTSDSQAEGWDS